MARPNWHIPAPGKVCGEIAPTLRQILQGYDQGCPQHPYHLLDGVRAVQRVIAGKQRERDEADAALRQLHDDSVGAGEAVARAVRQAIEELRKGLQQPTNAELHELTATSAGPMIVHPDGRLERKRGVGDETHGTVRRLVAGARHGPDLVTTAKALLWRRLAVRPTVCHHAARPALHVRPCSETAPPETAASVIS